jgi:hypothetical protein
LGGITGVGKMGGEGERRGMGVDWEVEATGVEIE